MKSLINRNIQSLKIAKEALILSIELSGIFSAGAGKFESSLHEVALGPYSLGFENRHKINRDRAAWSIEIISTQNLIITLDTVLEQHFPNRLKDDYFCFVRCLRNAFAHNPYYPIWELRDKRYRRRYKLPDDKFEWTIDLTNAHQSKVKQSQYRHASGLILLVNIGIKKLKSLLYPKKA